MEMDLCGDAGDTGSQADNPSNFYWRFNRETGCLILNEVQHSHTRGRLPGTVKAGAIFNSAEPSDIAGNASSWSAGFVYGIIDQMVWREDSAGPPQGASWFARGGYSVLDDSQLYSLFNTGFTYTGLIPGRDDDTAGVALSWAQFSPGITGDLDGGNRGLEMALEWTYQAQLTPWFTLQPDLQFIIQPGGSTALGNALVIGLSASVAF